MSKEAYFISKVAYFTSIVQQKYPNLNKKDSSPCVWSFRVICPLYVICPIYVPYKTATLASGHFASHVPYMSYVPYMCFSASLRSGAGDSFRVTCPLYVICPIYVFFCEPALWGSNEYLLKGLIEGIITGDDSLNQSLE